MPFDRATRHPEQFGDLGVRHIVQKREPENLPALVRQFLDDAENPFCDSASSEPPPEKPLLRLRLFSMREWHARKR